MSVFEYYLLVMYRIVFLTVFVVAASADGNDIANCRKLIHSGDVLGCCTGFSFEKAMNSDFMECRDLPKDPSSCTQELCIATKKGFATADGTIDKIKFEKKMAMEFEGQTEVLEAIKTNCIYGDISAFGPPEVCDLLKMKHCTTLQFITKCPAWSEEGNCKEKKESVEGCSKLFVS